MHKGGVNTVNGKEKWQLVDIIILYCVNEEHALSKRFGANYCNQNDIISL